MTQEAIAVSETPPLPGLQLAQQINAGFQTIATDFAGDDDPAALAGPYMTWADTANGLLKRRNDADSAWVIEGYLFRPAVTNLNSDQIPAADQGDIFVASVGRMSWFNGAYAPNNLPPRHRTGGGIQIIGANTVSLSACQVRSFADECDIILSSVMTKTLQQAPWTAGDGGSGLFTGVRAVNTWYHVFVMRNDATGAVDLGFDTSLTAANRPSGWSSYRRMGSVYSNSVNSLEPVKQYGHEFRWVTEAPTLSNVGVNSVSNITVLTPPGVTCRARLGAFMGLQSSNLGVRIFTPGETDSTGSQYATVSSGATYAQNAEVWIETNTSSQVSIRHTSAGVPGGFYMNTRGYIDFIGDN